MLKIIPHKFKNEAVCHNDCKLIKLPEIKNTKGNLTFIEGNKHIPFTVKRVYYLYDVPGGVRRGGHAHKQLEQLIIAASGSFDVVVSDGARKQRFHLNCPYSGLFIPKMIWRELDNFSSGSVCLVLASTPYKEDDYIRSLKDFRKCLRSS